MIDLAEARRYVEERSIPIPEVGCWLWLRSFGSHGYGNACLNGYITVAHRISYLAFVGELPQRPHKVLIQHSCDNHWCVAPHHLSIGTDATNALDKQRKGRAGKSLTADQVAAIRSVLEIGASIREVAQIAGVSPTTIASIRNGDTWPHVASRLDPDFDVAAVDKLLAEAI